MWQWSGGDDGAVVAADNDYGDRDVDGEVFLNQTLPPSGEGGGFWYQRASVRFRKVSTG